MTKGTFLHLRTDHVSDLCTDHVSDIHTDHVSDDCLPVSEV